MIKQETITELGNLLVVGAVAAVVACWLWARCNRLLASVFVAEFAFGVLAVTSLKLVSRQFLTAPQLSGPWQLSTGAPSGHVALSTIVYGCAAAVFMQLSRGGCEKLWALACLILIGAVAVTRVTLGAHTQFDVVAGALVGLPLVVVFWRAASVQMADQRMAMWPLGVAMLCCAVMALASGLRVSSAQFL